MHHKFQNARNSLNILFVGPVIKILASDHVESVIFFKATVQSTFNPHLNTNLASLQFIII